VLVYFGYPKAHEEDALRAIHAARAILEDLPRIGTSVGRWSSEDRVQVRIAIDSGAVVIGDVGTADRRERLALGDTVNVAARLLALGAPNEVIIGEDARRLLGREFDFEDLGLHGLRGIAKPVRAFRVGRAMGESIEILGEGGSAPFVGREGELGLLLELWAEVRQGRGTGVLLRGDVGMGKSRLVRAFSEAIAGGPKIAYECQCSPLHSHTAFYSVASAFARGAGFGPDDLPAARVEMIEQAVAKWTALDPQEVVPLLCRLYALPLPEGRYRDVALSADATRRRALDCLLEWLLTMVGEGPALVVVEDIHWGDASTLELLGNLLERTSELPLLVLVTSREVPATPRIGELLREVPLAPLEGGQLRSLIEGVAGPGELSPRLVGEIATMCDGVPFFAEELTKAALDLVTEAVTPAVQESREALSELSIPAKLQGTLMARIDCLSATAREAVQMAALLGREFPRELLAATTTLDAEPLERALHELEEAGLLSCDAERLIYHFHHVLIQELAHQSLLRRRRRDAHARIVEVLQSQYPERVAAEPEVFAWQCEMAGFDADAASYYERAGRRALETSAHHEALAQLGKAIELCRRRPESTERDSQELGLCVAIGVPLLAVEGYGSKRAARTNERARELSRTTGEGPELYQALSGLHLYHTARAELPEAAQLAAELLAFGERADDAFIRQWGHFFSSTPHYYRGEFAAALDHAERAIELGDARARHPGYLHEHDGLVSALVYAGMSLWNLGFPDSALERAEEAISIGQRSPHPWNRASALGFATLLHHMRREPEQVIRRAEETMAISEEHGFPMWLGLGAALRGWARSCDGIDASEEVIQGLQQSSATATRIEGPRVFSILAETYWAAGKRDEAVQALRSALGFSAKHDCRYWDAELYRLQGELDIQASRGEEGEESLRMGVAIAREQGARSLELRAVVSLAKRLQGLGREDEAHVLLAPVLVGWHEGGTTADQQAARAALAATSSSA